VPQITAISDCARVAERYGVPVIADGGVKYSGDVTKAIAAGASSVMIGSLFAGPTSRPGELVLYQGRSYKVYRGMGSLGAMKKGSKDRYGQGRHRRREARPRGDRRARAAPRIARVDPLPARRGLRSGMGYTGCRTILELRTKAKFVRITSQGLRESHVHDVIITEEAPNYRSVLIPHATRHRHWLGRVATARRTRSRSGSSSAHQGRGRRHAAPPRARAGHHLGRGANAQNVLADEATRDAARRRLLRDRARRRRDLPRARPARGVPHLRL
jgi:IMP dehydrogenase/GMP reductase